MKCVDEVIRASGNTIDKAKAEEIIKAVDKKFARYRKTPRDESFDTDPVTGRPIPPPAGRSAYEPKSAEQSLEERMSAAPRPQPRPYAEVVASHSGEPLTESGLAKKAAADAHAEAVAEAELKMKQQKLQVEAVAKATVKAATYGLGADGIREVLQRDGEGKAKAITNNLLTGLWKSMMDFANEHGWNPKQETTLELASLLREKDLYKKLHEKAQRDWTATERLAYDIRATLDKVRTWKNQAGANIRELSGYHPQAWDAMSVKWFGLSIAERFRFRPGQDPVKVRHLINKAREGWVEFVFPRIDRDRYRDDYDTPLNDADMKEVLRGVWLTIADHGAAKEISGGGGKMVDGLAASRELHFKDAASWYEANKAFGSQDLIPGIIHAVSQAGRSIALMETFGPWAEKGFETVSAYAYGEASRKTGYGGTGARRNKLYFDEIAGKGTGVNEDQYMMMAKIMQASRNWITASKLGSLLISMLPDQATLHSMAKFNVGSNKEMFEVMFKMLDPTKGEDRELARIHGFLQDTIIHQITDRFAVEGAGKPGWSKKAADIVMKVQGANWWNDAMKMTAQLHTGLFLAKYRKLSYDKLDPIFARFLERYHISADEWDLIRQADVVTINGMEVMTPGALSKLQHPKEMDVRAEEVDGLRRQAREAGIKATDMILNEADVMVLTPGMYERARVLAGTEAGTMTGEMTRSFWLFRTFAMAMATKVWPRVKAEGWSSNQIQFRAQLILGMLTMGALATQLDEIRKGRNPRAMFDLEEWDKSGKFWANAFLKGGGLGIAGDVLFSNWTNAGESAGRFIGGPMASVATDVLKTTIGNMQKTAEGKETHAAADFMQLVKNNTPGLNLWYARLALDHLLFYQAQEALNPGYLRRIERQVEKENQNSWWWAPTDTGLPTQGPDLSGMLTGQ